MRRLHPTVLLLVPHLGACAACRSARSRRPGERIACPRRGPEVLLPKKPGR